MQITELSEILRNGGVVGAGGAGFPSYAKLNEKADTIILNCAECEPLLRLHRQVLPRYAHEILTALNTVAETVGADRFIVAVKSSYQSAIEAVQSELPNFPRGEIKFLREVYPAGDELLTIWKTTGRQVQAGQLPISVGVIVYNVETMLNAYEAIQNGRGVSSKFITITGAVKNPITLRVPLGVTYRELIALAGGATIPEYRIIAGGPMTGPLAKDTDVVTKTSNAVIVLPPDHYVVMRKEININTQVKRAMSACCQCHYCTDLCPRHLIGHPIDPARLMRAVATDCSTDPTPFINANYCSGCGLCEMFSCFQGLSPRSIILETRKQMRAAGVQPPKPETVPVFPNREGRRVSIKRLLGRLNLNQYVSKAPMTEMDIPVKRVKLLLNQGIGAPAVPTVSVGDTVKVGQLIANAAPDKLSVSLHSSVDGTVSEVTDRYIMITC